MCPHDILLFYELLHAFSQTLVHRPSNRTEGPNVRWLCAALSLEKSDIETDGQTP